MHKCRKDPIFDQLTHSCKAKIKGQGTLRGHNIDHNVFFTFDKKSLHSIFKWACFKQLKKDMATRKRIFTS